MTNFTYKVEIKENDVWSELKGWVRPFYDTETLDESLDNGKIILSFSKRREPIKPFTPIRFTVMQERPNEPTETHTFYRLVSDSAINQRSFAWNDGYGGQTGKFDNPELFDHTISTIELTKLLEREVCDSLTFTHYLSHNQAAGAVAVQPKWSGAGGWSYISSISTTYYSPVFVGTKLTVTSYKSMFTFKPLDFIQTYNWRNADCYVEIWKNGKLYQKLAHDSSFVLDIDKASYKLVYHGEFDIRSYSMGDTPAQITSFEFNGTYDIVTAERTQQSETKTINDVVSRILTAGITRRDGLDTQQYYLDSAAKEKYSKITATEFHITQSTLFEALLTVGGYIHAIPRLCWDEEKDKPSIVTFDELGGDTEKDIRMYLEGYDTGIGIDDYCGAIDSTVENLVNSRDKTQGSVVEPYADGFKTVRCEEGEVEISGRTAIISTEWPIYRVTKLEMGYIDFSGQAIGDITPYLYEAAEYGTLSSYSEQYPFSKAYALTYKQGDNKISGLTFKLEDAAFAAFKEPAIKNIVSSTGKGTLATDAQYKKLAFRVTYIPLVNARVIQKKTYLGEFPNNTLIYNQGANTVEAEYYGEHLKGTIAKIGNREAHATYKFIRWNDIPKCGEKVDGMYVCQVEKEFEQNWIKCTLTLTPNFNKLSEYLAIDSNYRLYDVSEKQSVDRYVNYGENVIIGDNIAVTGNTLASGITKDGLSVFSNTLTHNSLENKQVSCAKTRGYSKTSQSIGVDTLQACISEAIGNGLIFCFKYSDNYSVGNKAVYYNMNKNVQQYVPYGDACGELETLSVQLYGKYLDTNWSDQESADGICNTLPEVKTSPASPALFSYSPYRFLIEKDSRERLIMTTQLHFRANRKSVVIGTQLGQKNCLVTAPSGDRPVIYFLPYRLNMLRPVLDLNATGVRRLRAVATGDVYLLPEEKKVVINEITALVVCKSWALVDEPTGKYYIGENLDLSAGDKTRAIYMTFKGGRA